MEKTPFEMIVTRRRTLQALSAGVVAPGLLAACTEGGSSKPAPEKKAEKKAPPAEAASKPEKSEDKPAEKAAASAGEGGDTVASCDTSGIDDTSKQMRKTLQYVEVSPNEGKYCNGCAQWKPPEKEGACGGCKLFTGPVAPKGYCLSYAPMAT